MLAPAAMPVLSEFRAGVGGATMTTVGGTMTGGGGGGGGGGASWASADVDANTIASAKAIAMARASPCPSLVFLDCNGVAEQRINIIPRKSAARA
jgi:hypothetical protein